MNTIEQQIWELCGSPMRYWTGPSEINGCIQTADLKTRAEPIDITLAHVMQLLGRGFEIKNLISSEGIYGVIFHPNNINVPYIGWKYLTENNEAALLRDQSEETQRAILEVVKK